MNPKALSLWRDLINGSLEIPAESHCIKLNIDLYLNTIFQSEPDLLPYYVQALKDNPYFIPNIELFLSNLISIIEDPLFPKDSNLIGTTAQNTLEFLFEPTKEKATLKDSNHYNYNISYQYHNPVTPQAIAIAKAYKKEKDFNDFLNTGRVT